MIVVATSAPRKFKIGSELIKLYQKTKFSHTLIVKDGIVYEASHGSVHETNFQLWRLDNKLINIYILDDGAVDLEYVKSMVGVKYGFGQIFRIAFKFLFGVTFNRNNGNARLICSEYVGRALRLDWVNDFTSPEEIDSYLKQRYKDVKDIY